MLVFVRGPASALTAEEPCAAFFLPSILLHVFMGFVFLLKTIFCCGLRKKRADTLALVGMTLCVQLSVMEMWLADSQPPPGGRGRFPASGLWEGGPHSFLLFPSSLCLSLLPPPLSLSLSPVHSLSLPPYVFLCRLVALWSRAPCVVAC